MKKKLRGTIRAWSIGRKIKQEKMLNYWEVMMFNSIVPGSWFHRVLIAAISFPTVSL